MSLSARQTSRFALVPSRSNFLVEKKVATFKFSLFAATEYVKTHLPSRCLTPDNARALAYIGLDPQMSGLPQEKWMRKLGAMRFAFRSSSFDAVVEAARAGVGLAALPDLQVPNGGLVSIFTEVPAPVQDLYLVYHRDLRTAPHIRRVVDAIHMLMRV